MAQGAPPEPKDEQGHPLRDNPWVIPLGSGIIGQVVGSWIGDLKPWEALLYIALPLAAISVLVIVVSRSVRRYRDLANRWRAVPGELDMAKRKLTLMEIEHGDDVLALKERLSRVVLRDVINAAESHGWGVTALSTGLLFESPEQEPQLIEWDGLDPEAAAVLLHNTSPHHFPERWQSENDSTKWGQVKRVDQLIVRVDELANRLAEAEDVQNLELLAQLNDLRSKLALAVGYPLELLDNVAAIRQEAEHQGWQTAADYPNVILTKEGDTVQASPDAELRYVRDALRARDRKRDDVTWDVVMRWAKANDFKIRREGPGTAPIVSGPGMSLTMFKEDVTPRELLDGMKAELERLDG